jgi:hypothetical protein
MSSMSLPFRPEVQALVRIRPVVEWFAHSFVPGPGCGFICSVLSSRARACRRNHQVPRVPLPDVGVTFIRETCPASSEDITPRSSLLQTHAPIPCGSPLLRLLASFVESSQVATSCAYRELRPYQSAFLWHPIADLVDALSYWQARRSLKTGSLCLVQSSSASKCREFLSRKNPV